MTCTACRAARSAERLRAPARRAAGPGPEAAQVLITRLFDGEAGEGPAVETA